MALLFYSHDENRSLLALHDLSVERPSLRVVAAARPGDATAPPRRWRRSPRTVRLDRRLASGRNSHKRLIAFESWILQYSRFSSRPAHNSRRRPAATSALTNTTHPLSRQLVGSGQPKLQAASYASPRG